MHVAALLWLLQDAPKPVEKKETVLAIVGADVHTVTKGTLRAATVIIRESKIARIGANLEIPEGATKIEAKGLQLYPGWVAATASGIGAGFGGGGKIADTVDPFTLQFQLAVACGVTSVFHDDGSGRWGGGGFGKGNAALRLTPGEIDKMVWAEPAALDFSSWTRLNPVQRGETLDRFRQAREYIEKLRDFEKRRGENKLAKDEKEPQRPGGLDDHIALLRGDYRARMYASTWSQIEDVLELLDAYPSIRVVLIGAEEAWIAPEELARRNVMCVIDPRSIPRKDKMQNRPNGGTIELAAKLKKGGVKFAIVPPTPSIDTDGIAGRDLMTLPWDAGFGIRGGLDEQTALEAITITAAEIAGIGDKVGSIEEGKEADLILVNGDPFHYKTMVQKTIVAGKVVYEKEKSPFFAHVRPKAAPVSAPAPSKAEGPKPEEPKKPDEPKKP